MNLLDIALLGYAKDTYSDFPTGTVIDVPGNLRAVIYNNASLPVLGTYTVCAIRGTQPDSIFNWLEDLQVIPASSPADNELGTGPEGPVASAIELWSALQSSMPADNRVAWTGHSLGGQLAVRLAAKNFVSSGRKTSIVLTTWDAPKAGDQTLVNLVMPMTINQYCFNGSVVTDWPPLFNHVREPLIPIGDYTSDPIEAHSVNRALIWALNNQDTTTT